MDIVTINKENCTHYDHCLIKNKRAPGYIAKTNWIKSELKNGLIIKRAFDDQGKIAGFIEYTPIENAWRAVQGKNYLFIHCIFVYPKKSRGKNIGFALLEEVIKDAKRMKLNGAAAISSKGSFIADKRLFLKFKFKEVASLNNHELLTFKLKKNAASPKFANVDANLKKLNGYHLFYTDQCPALAKPVAEIAEECKKRKIKLKLHYLKKPQDAQKAPFVSGTFGVVVNGKVYAERCISKTRFLNIVKATKGSL